MFEIRWRPSGGRGEYEYLSSRHDVLNKRLSIRVPVLETVIPTDVHCDFLDGKPRLRRDHPNDRSILNLPPLVTAIAALPPPRREDTQGTLTLPLEPKSYVIDAIRCDVVRERGDEVVLEPRLLRLRHGDDEIDIPERVRDIIVAAERSQAIRDFLTLIREGRNTAELARLATIVHRICPLGAAAILRREETDDIIADFAAREGRWVIRTHRMKERSRAVVDVAKRNFVARHGRLFCECCGIDFSVSYSPIGNDFIEAHHGVPLEELEEEQETRPDDLHLLCPNCHRMVHRSQDCSVTEVRRIIAANDAVVSSENLDRLRRFQLTP